MPSSKIKRNADSRCSRCGKCCSSFISLAFSTIGLIVAVVTYSAVGGLIFLELELDHEVNQMKDTRNRVYGVQEEYLQDIWNLTMEYSKLQPSGIQVDIKVLPSKISNTDGQSPSTPKPPSKPLTVFNSPADAEQIRQLNYSGLDFAPNFDAAAAIAPYRQLDKRNDSEEWCSKQSSMDIKWCIKAFELLVKYQSQIHNESTNFQWDGKLPEDGYKPKWRYSEALLYAVSAITTIGYGHVTPKTVSGRMITIVYCIIGLPLTFMCIAKLGHAFAIAFRVIYHTCCCAVCCLSCLARKQALRRKNKTNNAEIDDAIGALVIGTEARKQSSIVIGGKRYKSYTLWKLWQRNIGAKYELSLDNGTAVPTYLCLVVMGAYIAGGALMFSAWEGWEIDEGAYFCFVTLTTIGFGDYVPGLDSYGEENSNKEQVFCAIYVLVGLACVAMCFDLMQSDVMKKFKWVSQRLGFSKSKHAKTASDKKKEKVGLKLSCETLPRGTAMTSLSDNNDAHKPLTKSQSLAVPSPSMSANHRMCVSMPCSPTSISKTSPLNNFRTPLPPLFTSDDDEEITDSGTDHAVEPSETASSGECHSLLRRESDIV